MGYDTWKERQGNPHMDCPSDSTGETVVRVTEGSTWDGRPRNLTTTWELVVEAGRILHAESIRITTADGEVLEEGDLQDGEVERIRNMVLQACQKKR